jgi:SAM-dependent methyltransferase
MHGISGVDQDRVIDWSKTSRDYAAWRPNYPDRFFQLLASFGVGTRDQRILDLGTGVGFLALRFARQGARVTGVDIASEQIREAIRSARALDVPIRFLVARAEASGLLSGSFDIVTASQSWPYFDRDRIVPEVKRLLTPEGFLVTSHFCWLPREDPIARASEELVLQHNPKWTAADWAGLVPMLPRWAEPDFKLHAMFVFDVPVSFTRESWRGRMRACRGVGATLSEEETARFDGEHAALLARIAPERFSVLHRVDAHILRPVG